MVTLNRVLGFEQFSCQLYQFVAGLTPLVGQCSRALKQCRLVSGNHNAIHFVPFLGAQFLVNGKD